ncbi:MAG: UDP-3-O-acyl-N-acetylglucosamine deacetylase, partial [Candidatus Saganbacteria bacterium]|nr:UDP-3-O-acyl-N-acetylglucosamine deacetylase [Candidatus Saganbacteria bacterium]
MRERTIKECVSISGISLHSGLTSKIKFCPAPEGSGIVFARSDLPGSPSIPARVEYVFDTQRGVSLKNGGAEVRVVEHVLSAIFGLGIDNVKIELAGIEPPALDGSALQYVNLLKEGEIVELKREKDIFVLASPIEINDGERSIRALPHDRFKVDFMVNFEGTVIGRQEFKFEESLLSYEKEISPARTFGLISELGSLKRSGLARGASLENALGVSKEGYVNKPRFSDEAVRHKILDLIGDLALFGRPLQALIIGKSTG